MQQAEQDRAAQANDPDEVAEGESLVEHVFPRYGRCPLSYAIFGPFEKGG
jgi:hypothetical protein